MNTIIYNGEIAKKSSYEGYYCTPSGKVLSIKVKGGQGKMALNNPRELKPKVDKDGYLEYCISYVDENKKHCRKYKRGHRLVWESFFGQIEGDLTIDHINFNKQDNSIENLRLLTRIENGIRRNKDWVEERSFKYNTFFNGEYIGVFTKRQLLSRFEKITDHDIYKCSIGKESQKLFSMGLIIEKV